MDSGAPIELVFLMINRNKTEEACKLLREYNVDNLGICMAKGTAKSELGDIFAFGIIDRDIVCGFVSKDKSEELMQRLDVDLKLLRPNNGLALTMPINAIDSKLFRMLGFKIGGK